MTISESSRVSSSRERVEVDFGNVVVNVILIMDYYYHYYVLFRFVLFFFLGSLFGLFCFVFFEVCVWVDLDKLWRKCSEICTMYSLSFFRGWSRRKCT